MEHAEIRQRILDLARRELGQPVDLGEGDLAASLDSVQRLQLVVAIEDEFQICFDPEDEEEARTLDAVASTVGRRLGERPRD